MEWIRTQVERSIRSSIFLSVAVPAYFRYRHETRKALPNYKHLHTTYAPLFLQTVFRLEGIYYKIGQVFGSRRDVSPIEYQRAMQPLLHHVPAKPFDMIAKEVRSIPEIKSITPIAHASASVGQVHRGSFIGKPAAIKVLYPGIEARTRSDLHTFQWFVGWAMPSMKQHVDEFTECVLEEFDFEREGTHQTLLRKAFAKSHLKDKLYIPEVYTQRPCVLVTEWIEGKNACDVASAGGEEERRAIVDRLFECMAFQLFSCPLFSSDPHLGNFLIEPSERMVAIDFGQVASLSAKEKVQLCSLFMAMARCKPDLICNALADMGYKFANQDKKLITMFAYSMFETLEPPDSESDTSEVDRIQAFAKNMDLLGIQHVPRSFAMVVKMITILRGTCTLLNVQKSFSAVALQAALRSVVSMF